MADPTIEQLLQPSLGGSQRIRPPYSQTMLFFASFFGGPVAAVGAGALNAWRLGRLGTDLAWLLPLLAAYLGFEWWLAGTAAGHQAVAWLKDAAGVSNDRLLFRLLGLAAFCAVYLVHRRAYRTSALFGVEPAKGGWWVGLALVAAGLGVTIILRSALA